jgi:hypothetical protein
MNIQKHLALLGMKVEDRVTGYKGTVTSVGFDLYGCVQAIVSPEWKKGQPDNLPPGHWFDIGRLKVVSKAPVMEVPNFEYGPVAEGRKGAAEKPSAISMPLP